MLGANISHTYSIRASGQRYSRANGDGANRLLKLPYLRPTETVMKYPCLALLRDTAICPKCPRLSDSAAISLR
ncbi:hypothetical protein I546_6933 [Mycobacterium kansasii 732]|nr:hypothetical protein I546_6933 [Mycobacterium kansasii 732]